MLLTTLLSLSIAVNLGLAIVLYRNNKSTKDLQIKIKILQDWGDKAFVKVKKLEETRESLLEYVSNVGKDEPSKNGTHKKTRRSPKKKK
jgi:hypothetical protein|tara:strand:- start:11041 stop:11307 length:267 start_codon:yes stop_codon:yes gene_type:complete